VVVGRLSKTPEKEEGVEGWIPREQISTDEEEKIRIGCIKLSDLTNGFMKKKDLCRLGTASQGKFLLPSLKFG